MKYAASTFLSLLWPLFVCAENEAELPDVGISFECVEAIGKAIANYESRYESIASESFRDAVCTERDGSVWVYFRTSHPLEMGRTLLYEFEGDTLELKKQPIP
ncbi:MAG: hypothetical protein AAFN06_09385, partial [Pseudomonadota bacterium]